jgi:D-alanyl-lipoteichoic acid acyltransferase DltB (MBOAT superfamily)
VARFPQLVAGPIERAKDLLPQFHRPAQIRRNDIAEGLWAFLTGLFKKLALADYLAMYVDQVYGMPDMYQAPALLLATVAFAWQFYFEFSGYTDMARGVARLFGYRLTLNFDRPYLATDLGDYWRRWHISLSRWFHDYLYIPLGGNRTGTFRASVAILVTMLLAGLWYGAGWTFVVWGLVHGLARIATRPIERTAFYRTRVPKPVKQLMVFAFVCATWVFFRAPNLGDAWTVFHRIATSGLADPRFPIWAAVLTGFVWAYQILSESVWNRLVEKSAVRITLIVCMATYLALFVVGNDNLFVYFLYFEF